MTAVEGAKLPVWRLVAGILVLVVMATVLIALAPVYFEDYQLRQYMRGLAKDPATSTKPDDAIRASVISRARQLDLPVRTENIQIAHSDGKLQIKAKYAVQMDFPVYQVDVHF